ncbi:DUF397 domain-containing protein [Streptomyces malaysiensis]
MNRVDLSDAAWFKSSRSNGQSACVEVAFLKSGIVAARDSKADDGPVLVFTAQEWTAFVSGAANGEFGRA